MTTIDEVDTCITLRGHLEAIPGFLTLILRLGLVSV